MSPPITAMVTTFNSERHLARVLAALAWCDELLVLDSGSRDATLAIARAHQARIEHQEFLGYARQKQRGVDLARHDWVLVIDSDEVLEERARDAILALDLSDPARAWRLRRRTFIGAREVRHGVWTPDWTLRLFHRRQARFRDVPVHESVQPAGPVADLPGALLHYSFRDYADVFVRMGAYARLKAAAYRARGRHPHALVLCGRALWGLFRSYVLKRGWLDGIAGVVVALSLAVDMVVPLALAQEPASEPPGGSPAA